MRAHASGQAANAAGTDQHCMPPHRPSRASAMLEGVQASGASRLPTSGTGSAVSAAAVSMRNAVACHETRAGRRYTAAPKRPSSAAVSATVPTHSVSVGTHESCWLPSIHGTSATARRGGRGAPTAWRRNEAGCALRSGSAVGAPARNVRRAPAHARPPFARHAPFSRKEWKAATMSTLPPTRLAMATVPGRQGIVGEGESGMTSSCSRPKACSA
jgi:hypothetical protein